MRDDGPNTEFITDFDFKLIVLMCDAPLPIPEIKLFFVKPEEMKLFVSFAPYIFFVIGTAVLAIAVIAIIAIIISVVTGLAVPCWFNGRLSVIIIPISLPWLIMKLSSFRKYC